MTLFADGVLPDFNPFLTQEVMERNKTKYADALARTDTDHLFELCDAMGMLDSLDKDGKEAAGRVLNGLPVPVKAELRGSLGDALEVDPPFGIFVVYVLAGGELTVERSTWPYDFPRVLVVRGPHP
jgi:hypothetical protein